MTESEKTQVWFPDKQSSVLQVAVVDLNKTCGEQCKAQLDAEFGEEQSIFISCDVTDGDALKGETRAGTGVLRFRDRFCIKKHTLNCSYCKWGRQKEKRKERPREINRFLPR